MKDLPEIKVEVSGENPNARRLSTKWEMQSTGKKDLLIDRSGEHPLVYGYDEFELISVESEE
tara:strand:- start:143 stop:328 length:186 start_codon:yes stop_codon:yes gene_type:complete